MTDDPYTMEMRLCDDEGLVSKEPIVEDRDPPTHDESYLARLNRLINAVRTARGDKPRIIEDPYACTGHAHVASEHIRCTSPAHQRQQTVSVAFKGLLGHRSREVHQWSCPICAYTVTQSRPFMLERCPSCQDGQGGHYTGSGTLYITL